MISIRRFGPDVIYVAFSKKNSNDYYISTEIKTWLENNTKVEWGILKGITVGAFLSDEDATAFKLRFGL